MLIHRRKKMPNLGTCMKSQQYLQKLAFEFVQKIMIGTLKQIVPLFFDRIPMQFQQNTASHFHNTREVQTVLSFYN